MESNQPISIVIPTLNEQGNIADLFARIDASLRKAQLQYEMIVIDDHSTDKTVPLILSLASKYPVHLFLKKGQRGKAYSLLEGFERASYPIIAMIDADLQYPPEAIVPMYKLHLKTGADLVITDRVAEKTSHLRELSTRVFNFVFARVLFGISFDTQSGLKLFRKEILDHMDLTPSPWSFDLEFIVRSFENKFKIMSYTIPFVTRNSGETKVKLLNTTFELAQSSIKLRWRTSIRKIMAGQKENMKFLKNTVPFVILAFTLIGIAMPVSHSSALSLPATPLTKTVSTILTPVTTILNPITGQPQTSTTTSSSGAELGSGLSAATPTNSTATSTGVNQSTSNNAQPVTNQNSVTATEGNKTQTSAASSIDKSKLSAVTANEQSAKLFHPQRNVSAAFVTALHILIGVALFTALIFLSLFGIGQIKHKRYTYRKLSRS